MSSHNDPVQPTPFDAVQPATTPDSKVQAVGPVAQRGTPAWVLPALAGLIVLAVLVVFWLPASLDPAAPESAQDRSDAPDSVTQNAGNPVTPKTAAQPADAAPWSDAQTARLRKAAQEAAAELLDSQVALQEHGVEQWATTQFAAVKTLATEGDTLYRNRQFEEAQRSSR